jgi:hypothetical protein
MIVELSKSTAMKDADSKIQQAHLRNGRRAHYADKAAVRIIGPGIL